MTTEPTTTTGATGTSEPATGTTGATGTSEPFFIPSLPDIVTFAELAVDSQVILAKEAADKSVLESIGLQSAQGLKPKLVEWFMKGCPNAYPILSVNVQAPERCSDGEVRSLADYITFCSGGTIQDHVALLNGKLLGIDVSFSYDGTNISIVVSKMA